jgi:hypothetical protein
MIGVPMGKESGLLGVDLDRKPGGGDGVVTWRRWEEEHGAAPTRTHESPSTGQHKIFKYQTLDGLDIRSLPLNALGPGVEIKGEGGYLVFPPSMLSDGRFYRLLDDADVSDAPEWLLDKIRPHLQRRREAENRDGHLLAELAREESLAARRSAMTAISSKGGSSK